MRKILYNIGIEATWRKMTKKLCTISVMVMLAVFSGIAFTSCSDGDDEPKNPNEGEEVDPNTPTTDPDGTIMLSMDLGNQTTRIGKFLYLSQSGNLTIAESDLSQDYESDDYPSAIVSIGSCFGLGNITSIPLTGWSSATKARKGYGYIYYDGYEGRYYRIYVDKEKIDESKVDGVVIESGLVGFDVKYQHPFNGADVEITPEVTSLTLDSGAPYSQAVMFTNTAVVSFTISVDYTDDMNSDGWLNVRKCTDKAQPFLANGVMIEVYSENLGSQAREADIKLTTAFGKETVIKVTQSGREPFATILNDTYYQQYCDWGRNYFGLEGGTCTKLNVSTNVPFSDLIASTDAEWIEAAIIDNSQSLARANDAVRFVDGKKFEAAKMSRASGNGISSYQLILTAAPNAGESREAKVSVTFAGSTTESSWIMAKQDGVTYNLSDFEVTLTPDDNTIRLETNIPAENLTITSDVDWMRVDGIEQSGSNEVLIKCTLDDNTSYDDRQGHLKLSSDISTKTATITVTQRGKFFSISGDSMVWCDRNAGNATFTVEASSTITPKSSADWLTCTLNGNQLTLRWTSTTEDREANITFEGFDDKMIVVKQSRFAVGDSYDVDGVKGKVILMDGESRLVCRIVGEAAWSTEAVAIGANDMDDGRQNWNVVTAIPGWQELYPAFNAVETVLNVNGVTGWYIPSCQELRRVCYRIESEEDCYYWSSSEISAENAYGFNRYSAYTDAERYKSRSYQIIAVHRF